MSDPDHAQVDAKREQFQRLRQETLVQVESETTERIARNPTPTEEEARAGAFREMIEPQCRDAVLAMRRKGYATESSGFGGTHGETQRVDGNFDIDGATEEQLRAIGVTVHRSGDPGEVLPWTTALRFTLDAADLAAMKEKWDAIAAFLPDRGAPADPGVSGGTEDFIRERAPNRTDLLERIAELQRAQIAVTERAAALRALDAAEHNAERRSRERGAQQRDTVEIDRLRRSLGVAESERAEQSVDLRDLILTPEEEAAESERRGAPPHVVVERIGDREVTTFGVAHAFRSEQVAGIIAAFERKRPEFLIVEGEIDESIDASLPDEEVLQRYGEQQYLAWRARKEAIPVRSWDPPRREQLRAALAEHDADVVVGWLIASAARHVIDRHDPEGKRHTPSTDEVREMIRMFLEQGGYRGLEEELWASIDPDQLDLDAIARRYAGRSVAELNYQLASELSTPQRQGPTNDVLRTMNAQRDRHAIDVIQDVLRTHRRILVTAGASHVLTWEPALHALAESRAAEVALPREMQRSFLRVWSEAVSGQSYEGDSPASPEQLTTTLRGMVSGELDGHLELLARQQGKELPPLPELRDGASPEEQLAFVRALTERIHTVQNENNACITPRLSRELNGMDCSMSTWVMQHELAKTNIQFEWGSPVGHAVGIVTLRNGERYYADGQGGFVERIDTVERTLPSGGRVLDIANWREIQERRPAFFPRYVFLVPDADVASTIGNMDSMLYKQYLGPITEAQRQESSEEDVRIVEQLQPYARRLQDALRPHATGERDREGQETSPLNQVLETAFPASDAVYQRPEFRADESRMSMRIDTAREILGERAVFGPEAVRATLGIELKPDQFPPIPYSREELERARERGEVLVLYTDRDAEGRPLTPHRMQELLAGRELVFSEASGGTQDASDLDMEFFTREAPRAGWKLARIGEVPGTRHLSYEAQDAFMRRDLPALRRALIDIPVMWDRVGIPREQQPTLPTAEELEGVMEDLPPDAALPSAAEVVYQFVLRRAVSGERILADMAVTTLSRVQELPEIGEPERPIDVGLSGDDGISFHWRRSMKFGRPGATKPGAVPGIPIGYVQH